jgi:hypothetical protein
MLVVCMCVANVVLLYDWHVDEQAPFSVGVMCARRPLWRCLGRGCCRWKRHVHVPVVHVAFVKHLHVSNGALGHFSEVELIHIRSPAQSLFDLDLSCPIAVHEYGCLLSPQTGQKLVVWLKEASLN